MPQPDQRSLRTTLATSRDLSGRFLCGVPGIVALPDLIRGSCLSGSREDLRGRSVLIATADQFTAALALIELDGVARRVVLCPADLHLEHIPFIVRSVPVDSIVSDRPEFGPGSFGVDCSVACAAKPDPTNYEPAWHCHTEWILLTSGTTGRPKMVLHTLSTLAGAIDQNGALAGGLIWGTFYDIRRYGGLQIFLRAVLSGGSLILSGARESTADFLVRAGASGVTHISGTPSHWRRALMSPAAHAIAPQYIRLSGEIADQAILDSLRSAYPDAKIAHAFASTEAGVAFDVRDGLAGFPASFLEPAGAVQMKVVDGTLRIRSSRNAARYLGQDAGTLAGSDGFVDTGDEVELRGDRYYFVGRKDGVINVGGLKVHPEEVESVINRHDQVRMSLVKTRKNPITGALVVADVVLTTAAHAQNSRLEQEILQLCRAALPPHKVPASISFRQDLPVTLSGKMVRQRA